MGKRFLCLWLDNWPIQRLVVERPELRRQAVVLYATWPGRGQRVTALSPTAGRAGVRREMPLSEARSLLARSEARAASSPSRASESPKGASVAASRSPPPTYFLPHDPDADLLQLQQLALSCESYSPYVGLEVLPAAGGAAPVRPVVQGSSGLPRTPPPRPECLVLQVQSVAHLFGGEAGLWAAVQRDFQQRGYCVRAALADTIGAARAAAQHLAPAQYLVPGGTSDSADLLDPAHAVCLASTAGEVPTPLRTLPLAALRLNPLTIDLLRQLGVERIEQLLAIPRGDLRTRFGDEILLRLDQFRGVAEEVIPWLRSPAEFYAQQFLDFPTTDRTTIEVILGQLIESLCGQLRAAGRGGLRWAIRLDSPESPACRFELPLLQATALPRQILPLVRIKLEQLGLAGPQPGRGRKNGARQDFSRAAFCTHRLSVTVCESIVLVARQRLLFDDSPRNHPGELADLIDRLSTRLGPAHVVAARLQADGQAELAFRYEPLVGSSPRAASRAVSPRKPRGPQRNTRPAAGAVPVPDVPDVPAASSTSPAAHSPLTRPLRLFAPEEIQVVVAEALPSPREAPPFSPSPREAPPFSPSPSLGEGRPHDAAGEGQCAQQFAAPLGQPRQIVWREQTFAVHRAWGAERIETGWWRGPTLRRDYWRIELADGRWLWIYFDLTRRQWYLQGAF